MDNRPYLFLKIIGEEVCVIPKNFLYCVCLSADGQAQVVKMLEILLLRTFRAVEYTARETIKVPSLPSHNQRQPFRTEK